MCQPFSNVNKTKFYHSQGDTLGFDVATKKKKGGGSKKKTKQKRDRMENQKKPPWLLSAQSCICNEWAQARQAKAREWGMQLPQPF